jgi:acetyltransferase-like isoleucine patch superfamily enzyme
MLVRRVRHGLVWAMSCLTVLYYRLMGIDIGKRTYISINAHLDVRRGEISIGSYVDIARGACILSHTGYMEIKAGQKTVIEDNVKIFVNAIIFPGVRIGRDSVVGAGSVVMKDVPPDVVVLGNPARVVWRRDQQEQDKV